MVRSVNPRAREVLFAAKVQVSVNSGGFVMGGTMNAVLSRRDVLSKCFAAGLLVAIPPLSQSTMLAMWEQAEGRRLKPTPPNDLGPFYKPQAPLAHRLSRPGDPGLPQSVSGPAFDVNGEALPDANLEVWQARRSRHAHNAG